MPIVLNHTPIRTFNFPGGECSVDISAIPIGPRVDIAAYLYTSDDVMRLLLAVDAVRTAVPTTAVHLTIPYFPYGRQDRVCNTGEAFSLAVMASLINGLRCAQVTVLDPHSPKTMELLERSHAITQTELLRGSPVETTILSQNLILLAPDKGAAPKLVAYQRDLADRGFQVDIACCDKVRDPKTGAIVRTEVPALDPTRGTMIIDDICDGGRTFSEIARVLKGRGHAPRYLYVTHGIFSKGIAPLADFTHVYCYHTFRIPSVDETAMLTTIGVTSC